MMDRFLSFTSSLLLKQNKKKTPDLVSSISFRSKLASSFFFFLYEISSTSFFFKLNTNLDDKYNQVTIRALAGSLAFLGSSG